MRTKSTRTYRDAPGWSWPTTGWIIGGIRGANVINGKGGIGFIQKRGDHHDAVFRASHYPIPAR